MRRNYLPVVIPAIAIAAAAVVALLLHLAGAPGFSDWPANGQPAATASAPANPCVIRWHNGEDAEKKPGCTAALSDPQPQITVPIPPGVAAPSR